MSSRGAFLEAAPAVRSVLSHPAVAERWEEPSALAHLTVGALAGHLVRAVTTVQDYLAAGVHSEGPLLDPAGYFLSIDELTGPEGPDLDSELHRGIRDRARREAAGGHAALVGRWTEAIEHLAGALAVEPPTRVVEVAGHRLLLLDDYLVTRLVEMLVHTDDLGVSVGIDTPEFPDRAWKAVFACLLEVARRRHGDPAVLRALTRRERDTVGALRVL